MILFLMFSEWYNLVVGFNQDLLLQKNKNKNHVHYKYWKTEKCKN